MWRLGGELRAAARRARHGRRRPHRDARRRHRPRRLAGRARRGGVRLPRGSGGAGRRRSSSPRARRRSSRRSKTRPTGEAARRPDRPGDATGRPVRRARPRRPRAWAPRAIVAPADRDRRRSRSAALTRRCATCRPGGSRGSRSPAARRSRCWRRGWTPRRTSARRSPRSARGRARRSARWARRTPDLMPATFTTVGAGARVPPRRGPRAVRARRHRARRVWRTRSPRRGGRPSASTPTARGWRDRSRRSARGAPRRATSTPSRSRAPRRSAGSSARWAWSAGNPKVVVHRARHGARGARARPARLGRGTPAHDRGPGRGARAGPRRVVGRIARMSFPQQRPRRMRRTPALRALIRETDLAPRHLIAPLFVKEGIADAVPIASMPGQFQHTLESLRKEAVGHRVAGRHRVHGVRRAGAQGRRGVRGVEPGRHRAARAHDAARRARRRPRGDRRPLPGRVHRPRPLRRARPRTATSTTTRRSSATGGSRSRRPRPARTWSGRAA